MTKMHFIALADMIMDHNRTNGSCFTDIQIDALASFCKAQNSNFNRERWIDYIRGIAGPNGGKRHAI